MPLPKTYVPGFHDPKAVANMPYRRLGQTDMGPSLLSFGGGGFSGFYEEFEEAAGVEVVREALRQGINYIDTAPFYGEGRSETIIGKALRGVPREAFYISTKVGRYTRRPEEQFDYSAKRIKSSIEKSLQLLGLDYVDIIILHDVEFAELRQIQEESLPALAEIVSSGKARYLGISGYPLGRLWDVLSGARVNIDLVLTYARDTLIDSALKEYQPLFKSKGLGVINAAPTALAMLTNAGPLDWHPADPATKALCARAAAYCKERGVELGRLAIHHALESPLGETILVGMNAVQVLRMNLDLVLHKLTPEEQVVYKHLKEEILTLKEDLNWEGVELKMLNMVMK